VDDEEEDEDDEEDEEEGASEALAPRDRRLLLPRPRPAFICHETNTYTSQ
jgi:hypothetical protein